MIDEATPDAVAARLALWQRRLQLQDWKVHVVVQRLSVMESGTLGTCEPTRTKRTAIIQLLDPRDFECQGFHAGKVFDWETTLVHELLHLHMHDVFEWGKAADHTQIAAERMIDSMSRALVAAYRGEP